MGIPLTQPSTSNAGVTIENAQFIGNPRGADTRITCECGRQPIDAHSIFFTRTATLAAMLQPAKEGYIVYTGLSSRESRDAFVYYVYTNGLPRDVSDKVLVDLTVLACSNSLLDLINALVTAIKAALGPTTFPTFRSLISMQESFKSPIAEMLLVWFSGAVEEMLGAPECEKWKWLTPSLYAALKKTFPDILSPIGWFWLAIRSADCDIDFDITHLSGPVLRDLVLPRCPGRTKEIGARFMELACDLHPTDTPTTLVGTTPSKIVVGGREITAHVKGTDLIFDGDLECFVVGFYAPLTGQQLVTRELPESGVLSVDGSVWDASCIAGQHWLIKFV